MYLQLDSINRSLAKLPDNRMIRWWIVGIIFMIVNVLLLKWLELGFQNWFQNILHFSLHSAEEWSLSWSTVISSEICTLTRYVINDYWVFGNPRPTWKRCWEYHVANASSFFLWCFVVIVLGNKLHLDSTIAAILATVISVCLSMVTNFLWVWKTPKNKDKDQSLSFISRVRQFLGKVLPFLS